ncbi:MAG: hypothetical protein EAY66_10140, partial [Sphingobacteriales bacterium]
TELHRITYIFSSICNGLLPLQLGISPSGRPRGEGDREGNDETERGMMRPRKDFFSQIKLNYTELHIFFLRYVIYSCLYIWSSPLRGDREGKETERGRRPRGEGDREGKKTEKGRKQKGNLDLNSLTQVLNFEF